MTNRNENVHPIFAPLIESLSGQAKALGEVGRLKAIIRFLVDELENRDGYSPGVASCPECTVGTVPDNLNKGPCLYHQALTLMGKP